MKSYGVTIQMKTLWQYFCMVTFVFNILQDEIGFFLSNSLFLALLGVERLKKRILISL